MTIKVKRNTGIVGFATPITLKMNNEVIKKLKNNEEYIISPESEKVTVEANQWFFGSEEKQVVDNSMIAVKTNSTALLYYTLTLAAIIVARFAHLPILSVIGLIGIAITINYSTKNWFKLEIQPDENN